MKTYVFKLRMLMTDGNLFEMELPRAVERMSLELVEMILEAKAIRRGYQGMDDVQSYRIEMETYCC